MSIGRFRYVKFWLIGISSMLLFNGLQVNAQKNDPCYAGVFLTADDFVHDRLSHKINPEAKGYKFNFNFPADMTLTLKIVTPDSTLKFPAGSIYGYEECGKTSRFFAGGKELSAQEDFYTVEQAEKGFIIYASEFVSNNELFYSTDLTAPIHRLLLKNLRRDFREHPQFLSKVKKLKHAPDGLASRDANGFMVIKFYQEEK